MYDMELVELSQTSHSHRRTSSVDADLEGLDEEAGHLAHGHGHHSLSSTVPPSLSTGGTGVPTSRRVWPSVLADGWGPYLRRSFHSVVLTSKLNILLVAFPIAIIIRAADFGDGPLFIFSLLALCPLAERISYATDEMAKYTNPTIGSLLNATMGNVTELIVSIFALKSGLLRVVQLSLLGSILSNLLLVQGTAFLLGGMRYSQQQFSKAVAKTNVALLLLASLGLFLPMTLIVANDITAAEAAASGTPPAEDDPSGGTSSEIEGISKEGVLALSRLASILLLVVYGLLIFYQLRTHAHLFEESPPPPSDPCVERQGAGEGAENDEEEEDEPPILGPWGSVIWAAGITACISVLSEFIVDAIEGAASTMGLPILFIATILLPIVGNAAEHAAAVIFAHRNQLDVALGISIGSSTQIALFVVPLLVVLGWMMGQPLSLNFQPFESIVLLLTVIMSSIILTAGKSDYLSGVMMIVAYIIISAAFWLQKQPADLE